ncbi:DNA-binding MurR/RpiR family transcriptional regulator [Pararhizobium capsulatum DSM 1112]|uniref:DNA-binding MurR/RpiR family transcriptional regulator n=1 Tax=Pararhizobium capsulatum DSM 1112 TaxID=1121113 RepID=A0ABU0BXF1_9HYPH|nr:MurR/RpiR family transcriptional regulator [Pararhizobium capsulatum]MDQ0322950.1 DNA-binding MurR/RpiR family transcriptional regulator [Pararhizobium capsulatum DSM 1112]
MSLRDQLLQSGLALTPAEEKIVQVLLADYPTAGLGTATGLAKRAGVSDPTVGRLAVKLGFNGYPALQSRLLAEVEARLHSPLLMMEAKLQGGHGEHDETAASYLRSIVACIEKAVMMTPAATYVRAAKLVSDPKAPLTLLGGRFSRHLAGMLYGYLTQLRPDVRDIGVLSPQSFDLLIDMARRDVVVIFDYRRYQNDVVSFARQAAARGARIVLFTDPWLSPIAEYAEVTIVSPVEAASPYDTMAPAMAQIEALTTHILAGTGEAVRDRIERLEDVRRANAVTLDHKRQAEMVRDFPGPKRSIRSRMDDQYPQNA